MLKNTFIYTLLIFTNLCSIFALDTLQLTPSKKDAFLYEVDEIHIIGSKAFTPERIQSILNSKANNISTPHQLLRIFEEKTEHMSFFPRDFKQIMRRSLKESEKELKYFDKTMVENDLSRIINFYNQNGFHCSKAEYKFYGRRVEKKNILEFSIQEGERSLIGDFIVNGIDSIDSKTKSIIDNIARLRAGDFFVEDQIGGFIDKSMITLLDNGYYFASYDKPRIKIDTTINKDTIVIDLHPGRRMKYGNIKIIDSTMGQSKVSDNVKSQQLEIKEGDWYSLSKTIRSRTALYSLGVFDIVQIDTSQLKFPNTDSSLSFIVFNQYKKQNDYNASGYINRLSIDNSTTAGAELFYLHRNWLGAAQTFNPSLKVGFLDFSRVIANGIKNAEIEWQIGAQFLQPVIWNFWGQKVDLSAQILYSERSIRQPLKLKTFSVGASFPLRLPEKTYINGINLSFNFEWQKPTGLSGVVANIMSDAKTAQDSLLIREELYIYSQLDKYINEVHPYLTAATFSAVFSGDTRDNQFSPTKGKYVSILLDVGGILPGTKFEGNAKYLKSAVTYFKFAKISDNLILAVKGRGGYIHQFDKNNSIVPIDKQFFAGGASSVRGWPSRQLRYPMQVSSSSSAANYISDLVGSSAILEGTCELRFRFPRFSSLNEFLAEQVNQMGFALFTDVGNAWGSYAAQDKNISFKDLEKIAIASGLGFRYETPVGPIRVDLAWPVYDPAKGAENTIFSRPKPFSGMVFHIGLGNAF